MSYLGIDRNIKVIILGSEYLRAKAMLDELVANKEQDIEVKRESSRHCEIIMKDGTFYAAMKFSMNQKGQRCDLLYYDTKIDKEVFEEAFCFVTTCSAFKEIDSDFATYIEFDPEDFRNNKWKNEYGLFLDIAENLRSK